jgi:hypothetical protein
MVKSAHGQLASLSVLIATFMGCAEGNGSGGPPPVLKISRVQNCIPVVGQFPSGFDILPGDRGTAVVAQGSPANVMFVDLDGESPELLSRNQQGAFPTDTDGDGIDDGNMTLCPAERNNPGGDGLTPTLGRPLGVSEELAFVGASGYEEVMFVKAPDRRFVEFRVMNPETRPGSDFRGEDYPFLPAPGDHALRTAISTRACVYLPDGERTSNGYDVGNQTCCDRITGASSIYTKFTGGLAIAADRLFVATSNYVSFGVGYNPGTILVYDYDANSSPPEIAPHRETPIILTTGYNPTGVASYRTRNGRELIFVTQSGGLSGATTILTESFIDIIDAETVRTVATIPMGFAGLSFDGITFDPTKRIGLIGSWTLRVLYGFDLRTFDDESLYDRQDLVLLDGSDSEFPDVRIFHADSAFEIPDRPEGPWDFTCRGWTYVDFNEAGERAFVLERCDGTLTTIDILEPFESCDPAEPNPEICCDRLPLPGSCFEVDETVNVTAPFTEEVLPHGPSQIRVRRGEPGVDYSGPDVFYLVDLPDGQLCSVRIDSQESSR